VTGRGRVLAVAALKGAVSGLVGVAAMTAVGQVEIAIDGRPRSSVPARTLRALLGRPESDAPQSLLWNHAMHWGTGAVVGALRGVWAVTGIRGTVANVHHTAVRLAVDQTLENGTGVGAPPTTWPVQELVVDLGGKSVYSFVTGLVADRWIAPVLQSSRGRRSH
jgi:hypothetical protein